MKSSTLLTVMMGMVLVSASCGQTGDQSTHSEEAVTTVDIATEIVEPEEPELYFDDRSIEATGPLNDLDAVSTVVDVDGYGMTLHLRNRFISAELDPSGDKPGKTSIKLDYDSELTITNDLPDHDLNFGKVHTSLESTMTVSAVWPSASNLCQAYLAGNETGAGAHEVQNCSLVVASFVPRPLRGGQSESLEVERMASGVTFAPRPVVRSIPEGSVDDVLKDLNNPEAILLEYWGHDTERFVEGSSCDPKLWRDEQFQNSGIFIPQLSVLLSAPGPACYPKGRFTVNEARGY